jgi:hypothetical protein
MLLENTNPFTLLEQRFDKLESILLEIKTEQSSPKLEINPHERLTRKDILKEYRVSYGTIHNAMNKGTLHYDKVGRKTLFKRINIESWLKNKGVKNE